MLDDIRRLLQADSLSPHGICLLWRPEAEAAPRTEAAPGQEFVLLDRSDTGSGMSEEVKAQAFEPFFPSKPLGQGHGFVPGSGGPVTIDARLGQGTSVRLYLARAA